MGYRPCDTSLLGGQAERVTVCVKSNRSAIGGSRKNALSWVVSYDLCDTCFMADTITFRPDADTLRALSVLTRDGTPVSSAVRSALLDAARLQAHEQLRAEAASLAEDPRDRAEVAQVLRDMETLRAW